MTTTNLSVSVLSVDLEKPMMIEEDGVQREMIVRDAIQASLIYEADIITGKVDKFPTFEDRFKRFDLLKRLKDSNGSMEIDSKEQSDLLKYVGENYSLPIHVIGQVKDVLMQDVSI
jgi:hypothetical protein